MKRRDFLVGGGSMTFAAFAGQDVAFARTRTQAETSDVFATAKIIWSADTQSVELYEAKKGETTGTIIANNGARVEPDLHSAFVKLFTCKGRAISGLFHVFAFTRYQVYVNGSYVGRGPCRYQNEWPEYDTHNITAYLKNGQNVISVLVHRDSPGSRIMLHEPGFVAAMELNIGSSTQIIVTEESWLSAPETSYLSRPKSYSSISESIDIRKSLNWWQPRVTEACWKPSVIVPLNGSVTLHPRSIPLQWEIAHTLSYKDSAVSDQNSVRIEASAETASVTFLVPQIMQAYHLLEFSADEGTEIELTYIMADGIITGISKYIARSGSQIYRGGDTFAFKTLKITAKSGRLTLRKAHAVEVRYPFERAGSFTCNDEALNRLWEICARSLEVLSEDAYVDCADRERSEWIDCSPPAFDCTRVIMKGPKDDTSDYWGDARLLGGLLRRFAMTQGPDGQIRARSCADLIDVHTIMEDRSCDWLVLMKEYFDACGDKALIQSLWPVVQKLLDWYRQRLTPRGLVLAREWEVWDNPLRYQVCEGAGLNAMVYKAFSSAADLATKTGKTSEGEALKAEAETLRKNFNRELWNEDQGCYDGALFGPGSQIGFQLKHPFLGTISNGRFGPTVQGNLFAIYAGLVPTDRLNSVRTWVLNHQKDVTKPMSFYYLFNMIYSMNDPSLDSEILKTIKDQWKLQIASDLQTTWEDLDGRTGSKFHVYSMHPAYFLTAFVLGARRLGPQDDKMILLEPHISGLEWAKGKCITEFGPVDLAWKVIGGKTLDISCDIPKSAQAKVRIQAPGKIISYEINGRHIDLEVQDSTLETMIGAGHHALKVHYV